MRIVHEYPPWRIYKECRQKFGVSFDDGVVWTYGDTIFTKYPVPKDLLAHERVHSRQQIRFGVMGWWEKYLEDDEFRFKQELEAYQAQWKYIKKNVKSRDDQAKALIRLARDLSGPMYGNLCSYQEALKNLKNA